MGSIFLVFGALCVRATGTILRTRSSRKLSLIVGAVFCALSAWIAVSAWGAASPMWPACLAGVAAALADHHRIRRMVWVVADVVAAAVAGLLSSPVIDPWILFGLTAAVTVCGYAIDTLLSRLKIPVAVAALPVALLGLSVLVGIWFQPVAPLRMFVRGLVEFRLAPVAHLGVTPLRRGGRVALESGAIAWFEEPFGKATFPGALLFHGASPLGSRDPAAQAVRRALVASGFAVLAVDHPGFGESPSPGTNVDPRTWDPLPTVCDAFIFLRSRASVGRILGVGHSMGTSDVLRLLNAETGLHGAVLLGGSGGGRATDDRYRRFHTDRRLKDQVPRELFREVYERYYDKQALAENLQPIGVPIAFVEFEVEHEGVAARRDLLHDALPPPKTKWELRGSTHYLSSFSMAGVVISDVRPILDLKSLLSTLAPSDAIHARNSVVGENPTGCARQKGRGRDGPRNL